MCRGLNIWHELKEYIHVCHEVKPANKDQLVNGISQFQDNLDAHKCCRYIDHLKKVLPRSLKRMVMLITFFNVLQHAGFFVFVLVASLTIMSVITCLYCIHTNF